MDLYRLCRSITTWMMCLVTIGMVVFTVSMTKYDISLMKEDIAVDRTEVGTNISEEEVEMVIGISSDTKDEWVTGDIEFSDLLNTQIGSGIFLILTSIFVTIFVCAEQKNGYIKNIAGQFQNRAMLVFSKTVAVGVQVLLLFLVLTVAMFITGKICFGSSLVFGSVGDLLKTFGGQYVLHFAFASFILCLGIFFNSSALSMTLGILVSCKVTSLLYALTERFSMDVSKYAIEVNVTRYAQVTDRSEILTMLLSAAAVIVVAIGLAAVVMQKRDVK